MRDLVRKNSTETRVAALAYAQENNYRVKLAFEYYDKMWFDLMTEIHSNGKEGNYKLASLYREIKQTLMTYNTEIAGEFETEAVIETEGVTEENADDCDLTIQSVNYIKNHNNAPLLNTEYTLKRKFCKSTYTPIKFSECGRFVWVYCKRSISKNSYKWMKWFNAPQFERIIN
jgi:hypothetical protein